MGEPMVSGAMPSGGVPAGEIRITDIDMAKSHFHAGVGYYQRDQYEKAIAEFLKAYDLTKKPELQYNIARAYEKLQNYGAAIAAYRLYLQEKPDAPDRELVETKIALFETYLKKPAEERVQRPPDSRGDWVDVYLPEGADEDPADIDVQKYPAADAPAPYRTLMWTSLAVSVVGLAVGGISYYQAGRKEQEYTDLVGDLRADGRITGSSGNYRFANDAAKERDGSQLNNVKGNMEKWDTIATVGFVGAAVTLGLGGFFFWKGRDTPQMTLQPNAGGGSIHLSLGF